MASVCQFWIGCVFVLITVNGGTTANKRNHIIDSFLKSLRKDNLVEIPIDVTDGETIMNDYVPFPVDGPEELTLSDLYTRELRRARMSGDPDDSFRPADIDIENHLPKRFTSLMNDADNADYLDRILKRYVIKKAKREPEHFPIDMYPAQGGKQQLEVDLDNEFSRERNTIENDDAVIPELGHEFNGKADGPESSNDDIEQGEQGDIVHHGGNTGWTNEHRVLRKRFWAASSLYKLRIPKTKAGRSRRMRMTLPKFDPILYFIGLGK